MVGNKIKLYRQMNGWSLDELSSLVIEKGGQVSKVALSKFERGQITPSPQTVEVLARVFGIRPLDLVIPRKYEVVHLGFRKKHSLSRTDEKIYQTTSELELEKYVWLNERTSHLQPGRRIIERKEVNTLEEAEEIAVDIRDKWELGEGPIPKVATVMEKNGCFVKPVDAGEEFDAYSVFAKNIMDEFMTGLVLYNQKYTGDRQRFTLSHELGHFLVENDDRKFSERLANRFASAFLMPRNEIRSIVGFKRHHLTLEELIEYKKYFGASIQAILYRLKDVGTISEDLHKDWSIALNVSGMRKNEPGEEVPKEDPEYIRTLVMRAVSEGYLSREDALVKFRVEIKDTADSQVSKLKKLMSLPKEERKRLLEEQARASIAYYAEDRDLKEFREADLSAIDD